MYQPRITFITATFNSEKTLEQTISSILDQTYRNIEYIIVDGGSTDGTIDILKKFGDKIRWISEPDNGICDAMGKGIELATGDYVNILGSDDALADPHILDAVIEELQDKPDLLSCNRYNVNEITLLQYPFSNERRIRNGLRCIPTEGAYIGRHIMKKYPFDRELKLISDYKLSIQCQLDKTIRIKYSNLYTAFFSDSGASSDQMKVEKESVTVYEKLNIDPRLYYGTPPQGWYRRLKKIIQDYTPLPLLLFLMHMKEECLKYLFKAFPSSVYYMYFRIKHPNAVMHTCNNNICRWCRRG